MLELCTAREFEAISFELALQAQFQRRFGFGDLGNLSKISESAICSSECRPAVRANQNDRRARLEFNRPGTRGTIGGENGYRSPPAAVLFKSRISDLKLSTAALPRSSFVTLIKPAPNEAFNAPPQSHSGRVRQQ